MFCDCCNFCSEVVHRGFCTVVVYANDYQFSSVDTLDWVFDVFLIDFCCSDYLLERSGVVWYLWWGVDADAFLAILILGVGLFCFRVGWFIVLAYSNWAGGWSLTIIN